MFLCIASTMLLYLPRTKADVSVLLLAALDWIGFNWLSLGKERAVIKVYSKI
jgi:hypothetical protein